MPVTLGTALTAGPEWGRRFFCVWLVNLGLAFPVAAQTPHVPASEDKVLQRLPAASEVRKLAPQRQALENNPGNLGAATALARTYIKLARQESDPRYLGYAQASLSAWPEDAPPAILVLRATIAQSRHEFDTALTLLDQALTIEPDNVQAWITQAHILLALGRPGPAQHACEELAGRVQALVTATCINAAIARNGQLDAAHANLRQALASAARVTDEIRGWSLTELGEQAQRLGRRITAADYFRTALRATPGDAYLLAAYADLLLTQGREQQVLDALAGREDADALLLRLAIAGSGTKQGRRWQKTLANRFEAAAARGNISHHRERARFALDVQKQPERALELAVSNWAVQREPADILLLLRCAVAAEQPQAAQPVRDWIAAHDYEDHRLTELLRRLQEIRP